MFNNPKIRKIIGFLLSYSFKEQSKQNFKEDLKEILTKNFYVFILYILIIVIISIVINKKKK